MLSCYYFSVQLTLVSIVISHLHFYSGSSLVSLNIVSFSYWDICKLNAHEFDMVIYSDVLEGKIHIFLRFLEAIRNLKTKKDISRRDLAQAI